VHRNSKEKKQTQFIPVIMGNSVSVSNAVYPPREYYRDGDIPFVPDGNDPALSSSGRAMRVRATSNHSNSVKFAVRRTIRITDADSGRLEVRKQRIREVASILSRNRHHHIVNIITTYFYNEADGFQFAIVMDLAECNLVSYLDLTSKKAPRVEWFGCLIGVVAYIHQQGIQHLNIKPQSILIKNEKVLLTNFDISALDGWKTRQSTAPRWALGTTVATSTYYSAPEVQKGRRNCGRAADIFSLGAVFMEMLLAHSSGSKDKLIGELRTKLQSDHDMPHIYYIDTVDRWLASTDPPPKAWESQMLSLCRDMLDPDRDARPLAEELRSRWKGVLDSDSSIPRCPLCEEAALGEEKDTGNGPRALHRASAAGKVDKVRSLLGSGTDVNAKDNGMETALFYAAGNGHEKVVEVLLEKGVEVDAENKEAWTALHYAAGRGQKFIVKLLLDQGADINKVDADEWGPLHFAARHGHEETVQLLLERGADIQARDSRNQTALHLAVKGGNKGVVDILLKAKADVNQKSKEGLTALHFAALSEHKEILKMLVDYYEMTDIRSFMVVSSRTR
jgi:ankyrin repeat protein/tRNA A-37 threonylcarbamoyl transferase component Bud32